MKTILTKLVSGSLIERALGLLLVGYTVLAACWVAGFLLLPEGIIRGKTLAGRLYPTAGGLLPPFFKMLLVNFMIGFIGVLYMNRFKGKTFPAGYPIICLFWAFYGILLGTNSFSFPGPDKYAPSLSLLLSRSGLFEISAYTLVAAASAESAERLIRPRELGLIFLAFGLLVFAVYREALQVPGS